MVNPLISHFLMLLLYLYDFSLISLFISSECFSSFPLYKGATVYEVYLGTFVSSLQSLSEVAVKQVGFTVL